MTHQEFEVELNRLKDQWPNSYGTERKKILFLAFKNTTTDIFREAVGKCLASHRQAPLIDDLEIAVQESRSDVLDLARTRDTIPLLEKAAEQSTNKEFVGACMKVIQDREKGKLTTAQFNQACDLLDETAARLGRECTTCADSGYTTQGEHKYLYRCFCNIGRARPEIMYGPKRVDGGREEFYIAIWQRPLSGPPLGYGGM